MFLTKTKQTIKRKVASTVEHTFSIEDVLTTLPKSMQHTLAAWYTRYTDEEASSFALFNNMSDMDQHLLLNNVLSKKSTADNDEELRAFFDKVPLPTLFDELGQIYKHAPYHIEDGQFHALCGYEKKGGDHVALVNSKREQEQIVVSAQAMLLSRLFEAEMRKSFSKHVFPQYMELQYGSLFETHTKTLEHLAVTSLLSSYPAAVATCLYYVFSRQLYRLLHDDFSDNEQFAMAVQLHRAQEAAVVGDLERNFGAEKVKTLHKSLATARAAIKDKDLKLQKQKDETKKQKDLLKEARSSQKQVAPVQTNKEEIQQLQTKLKEAKDSAELQKRQLEFELKAKEREVRNQKKEVEELKVERTALLKQLNDQKQTAEEAKVMTLAQWMELGKPLLHAATADEEQQVEQFFAMFTQLWTDRRANERPQMTMHDMFGYYEPRDDGHYIVLMNGEAHLIEKLPSPIYLRHHQFLRVNASFEFVKSYYSCYYDLPLVAGCQFSVVEFAHDDTPQVFANGKLAPLRLKAGERVENGQIVAYTRTHELARYYVEKPGNLNDFAASIKLKKHELYHVQQLVGNGAVVVKPFTQEVLYKELPAHHELNVYDTFTFHDNDIVHVFRRHAFYEGSDYYTKRQLATIEEIAENCFIKKENREIVILKYNATYYTPTPGEVIYVDEHHRYLYKLNSNNAVEETTEQKLARGSLYQPKKETVVFGTRFAQDDKRDITVVTRVDFFDSYRNRLSQYYNVTLVDGFGPLEKITQAARKGEVVVLCTGHMSHTTRQKVYDTVAREKVIEDDSVGAQGIELRLHAHFLKN